MSISVLIVGANKNGREAEISKKFADNPFTLKPEGYTIDYVRDLQKQISRRPAFGNYKIAVIPEAQNLTLEAQNSLLKTLEEPPPDTFIILTAPSTDFLLPTIVSRCEVISLPPLAEIRPPAIDPKNITTREDAINYVENLIFQSQKDLLKNTADVVSLRRLLKARQYLKANTNIKLTLESLNT